MSGADVGDLIIVHREPLQKGVVVQAVGERFGVVVANIRVVQVEELEVRVVVQRIAEPNRALVVEGGR